MNGVIEGIVLDPLENFYFGPEHGVDGPITFYTGVFPGVFETTCPEGILHDHNVEIGSVTPYIDLHSGNPSGESLQGFF